MTDGGRPTDEVSDDTDILPLELLPTLPPIEKVAAAPEPPRSTPPPPPAPPAPQPAYSYATPATGGRGSHPMPARRQAKDRAARLVVLLLLALLLGLVALIAAVAGGLLSYADIARLVGLGPGEIMVQNLRDDAVSIELRRLDSRGESVESYEDRIEGADVRLYANRERGAWDIVISGADGARLGTCRLTVAGNGEYRFVILPSLVVVAQGGVVPVDGDEFVLATSALCRRDAP